MTYIAYKGGGVGGMSIVFSLSVDIFDILPIQYRQSHVLVWGS